VSRRPPDHVLRNEPARGPLPPHHLDGKARIGCVRWGNVTQARVEATVDGDGTARLVDHRCYLT
jgi:hypothetical protein